MQDINLSTRLTHRYVGTHSHLDSWEYLGTLRVTPPRVVEAGNDYDAGDTVVRYARIRRSDDFRLLKRAIESTLSRHGCSHEYDCCGCASYTTQVTRIRPRLLLIRTRTGYNY